MKGARIGKNYAVDQNVNVTRKALLGDNIKVQNNISIYDAVRWRMMCSVGLRVCLQMC